MRGDYSQTIVVLCNEGKTSQSEHTNKHSLL